MLDLRQAEHVKIFVGAFWNNTEAWTEALHGLQEQWGPCDILGDPVPFMSSDYYEAEMGSDIQRQFVAFPKLAPPDQLADWKIVTNELEAQTSSDGKRRVNLDVGYLDYQKVVLASTKGAGHKIYMGKGIWADLMLMYEHGGFTAFPWTFADFQSPSVQTFLLEARAAYKDAMRKSLSL